MKPFERAKLARSLRQETRRFRLVVLVIGFFLVTLTFIVIAKPEAILFADAGAKDGGASGVGVVIQKVAGSSGIGQELRRHLEGEPKVLDDEQQQIDQTWRAMSKETGKNKEKQQAERNPQHQELGSNESEGEEEDGETEEKSNEAAKHKVTLPTVSNYTIPDSSQSDSADDPSTLLRDGRMDGEIPVDTHGETAADGELNDGGGDAEIKTGVKGGQDGSRIANPDQGDTMAGRLLCDFSNFRTDVCDMEGNVVVFPNASSVVFVDHGNTHRDELYKMKPYPRKGDQFCMSHVTDITVRSAAPAQAQCTKRHAVPGIVFGITGYTGNLFHDFTDVIVPLFATAHEFGGEVQFLVTDWMQWWVNKYEKVLRKLSNYPLIDMKTDGDTHCFRRVIVGVRAFNEFTIDPAKAPNGYTMVDFGQFMREAYALPRETATTLGERPGVKPRLLVISRKRTRMFLNLKEIVGMAEGLGFDVVVDESDVSSDISRFAKLVNSADVMMGVHGAGLTNCVFLPRNATLIQVVPWGGLDWIARLDFGGGAEGMGLRYVQYSIGVDESSLTEQYPRDHEIFKNPLAFHGRGFEFIRRTFMDKQNVRLDVNRFKGVLLQALDHFNP